MDFSILILVLPTAALLSLRIDRKFKASLKGNHFWEARHIFLFIFLFQVIYITAICFHLNKIFPWKLNLGNSKRIFPFLFVPSVFSWYNCLFIEFLNDKIIIVSSVVIAFITISTGMHVFLFFIKFTVKWGCFVNVYSSCCFCKQRFFFYIDLFRGCLRHFVLSRSTFQ